LIFEPKVVYQPFVFNPHPILSDAKSKGVNMSDNEFNDEWFDTKRAARYLKYSPGTLAVWRSTKRYDLKHSKIGRSIRYRKSSLDEFAEARLKR